MNFKTYEEFLAENLAGEFCYYGPGSLVPIVQKLWSEGKSKDFVYSYLTHLGVDDMRKQKAIGIVYGSKMLESVLEDDSSELLGPEDEDELTKKDDEEKDDEEKDDEEKDDKDDKEKSDDPAVDALQKVVDDAKKLDKIRKVLKEAFGGSDVSDADLPVMEAMLAESISTNPKKFQYAMYYPKNGVESGVSGKSTEELVHFAKGLKVKQFEIFRNGSGFHSSEQEEFLVAWGGDSRWAKRDSASDKEVKLTEATRVPQGGLAPEEE